MASTNRDGLPPSGIPVGASGVLPELETGVRALETLVEVLRQRSLLATAFKRATVKLVAEGDKASSPGAQIAWRRHTAESLESVAKRAHALTEAFSDAVDDVERAVRGLVARSAAGGLTQQEQTEVDEAFAALLRFAADVAAVPPLDPAQRIASAFHGLGWRKARRALHSIITEMHGQWQQLQVATEWARLVQNCAGPGD